MATYQQRLTKPENGNKFFNTVGKGGWSTAIVGSPKDAGCDVLSNCVGYAFGRFNEIAYQLLGEEGVKKLFKENGGTLKNLNANSRMPLLQPLNAENFYDVALTQGLTVSQTPSLGACMVWQNGNTRDYKDGSGHVAIVEEIISVDCIKSSESGYGCINPFLTQLRYKSNGNWGAGSGYKFLGFIKNPAVDSPKDPYPMPTRTLKEGMTGDDVKWVQWKLKNLCYLNDSIDGWFGIHTCEAVLYFQLKNGLSCDGIVGNATRELLSKV